MITLQKNTAIFIFQDKNINIFFSNFLSTPQFLVQKVVLLPELERKQVHHTRPATQRFLAVLFVHIFLLCFMLNTASNSGRAAT